MTQRTDEIQEFDQILQHARQFTDRLRRDNHDLEARLAASEAANRTLVEEGQEFTDAYLKIEEQNNNLSNLFVASCQLHSTLDYEEAIRIVQDIVINLIGAESFHLLTVNEKTGLLEVEVSEGQEPPCRSIAPGEGVIGRAMQTGESYFAESVVSKAATAFEEPIAVIPLRIKDRVIGAISINKLLVQKKVFTVTDHELFILLAGNAASALVAARLYSTSQRKLNTLKGFVEILKAKGGDPEAAAL